MLRTHTDVDVNMMKCNAFPRVTEITCRLWTKIGCVRIPKPYNMKRIDLFCIQYGNILNGLMVQMQIVDWLDLFDI